MKKVFFICLSLVFISFISNAYAVSAYAAKPAKVEVLYMNHGPLMDTLDKMKNVFSSYGNKIGVSWYDFDSREGEDFMSRKGIHQHIPLVIWIDGNPVVKLGSKEVKFVGFPTGAGPLFFQGKWTLDDLKAALDQVTTRK